MSKSLTIEQPVTDIPKCENLGCTEYLGYFDIKNKRRFCRKCRVDNYVLRWKCKNEKCPNILNSSQFRETKYYCNFCRKIEKLEVIS